MIGPHFAAELFERGLSGLPISWDEDGTIRGRDGLTTEQNAALDAALADHDPEAVRLSLEDFRAGIEAHLDAVAREIDPATGQPRFGSAHSASTYVTSTVPQWKADAEAFVAWRDAVWVYAYTAFAEVSAEQRLPPESVATFIAELPMIQWPQL